MIAVPVTQVAIFYFGVNANSILMAFQRYDSVATAFKWAGFTNFKAVIHDIFKLNALRIGAKNSMIIYAVGILISMPLNIFFAYFLYKKVPLSGFYRVILFMPAIISGVVLALIFKYFVEYGVPSVLDAVKIKNYPNFLRSPDWSFIVIIVYGLWAGFGAGLLLYNSAMTKIPYDLIEYGQIEGATMFQEFFKITVPLIFPTITTFLVIGLAGIFTAQGAVFMFYGSDAEQYMYTYGYYFFTRIVSSVGVRENYSSYPYVAASGLIFTLIAAPLTLLLKYLLEKFGPSAEF